MKLKDILIEESSDTLFFKFTNTNKMEEFRKYLEGDEEADPSEKYPIIDVVSTQGNLNMSLTKNALKELFDKRKLKTDDILKKATQFGGELVQE